MSTAPSTGSRHLTAAMVRPEGILKFLYRRFLGECSESAEKVQGNGRESVEKVQTRSSVCGHDAVGIRGRKGRTRAT